jgi:hypothetical protein
LANLITLAGVPLVKRLLSKRANSFPPDKKISRYRYDNILLKTNKKKSACILTEHTIIRTDQNLLQSINGAT